MNVTLKGLDLILEVMRYYEGFEERVICSEFCLKKNLFSNSMEDELEKGGTGSTGSLLPKEKR